MRKFFTILAVAALFALAACQSPPNALTQTEWALLTPQAKLAALRGYEEILVDRLNEYTDAPPCNDVVVAACYSPRFAMTMFTGLRAADEAIDAAEAELMTGGKEIESTIAAARRILLDVTRLMQGAKR